jgi:soluble lytic murein transglycosylase-like protein
MSAQQDCSAIMQMEGWAMRKLAAPPGRWLLSVALLAALLVLPGLSEAQVFRYVDKDGVLHFTNVPTLPSQVKTPTMPPYAANLVNNMHSTPSRPFYPLRSLVPSCNLLNQSFYDPHIQYSCRRYGLDYRLVKALIRAESAYDAGALSPKGAMGLMQLMPGTSRDLGVTNPFDPGENIDGGVRYLRFLLDRFNNNIALALAAYNAGPEAVQKHGGIPPYEETRNYVQRVLEYYVRSSP